MLTYLGITPSFATDPNWFFYDVVDLGLGQWVLLQQRRPDAPDGGTPDEIRAIGVYRYGKWQQYIAPAVWQADGIPGAGINRDAQYLWRAPNIADNPNDPPVPPQGPGFAASGFTIDEDTVEVRSTGPVDNMPPVDGAGTGPGNAAALPGWYVLDGSPTRWANVGVGYRYTLASGAPDAYLRPVAAWVSINGVAIEVPDWEPWSDSPNYDPFRLSVCWIRWGSGWTTSTFTVPVGTPMFQPASFEISLGSRYGVCLANHSVPVGEGSQQVVNIAIIDRARNTARSMKWMGGTAGTGAVVKGNTAVFYGTNSDLNNGKPVRVILDLTTMTMKFEESPPEIDNVTGTYAPSYFSDVPRIVSLTDSGSGEGPRRLVMDNDMIEVAGQHISYSGNNLLLRTYQVPGFGEYRRDDVDRSWVELVVWTPDSNLAGGDSTLKGYFL